MIPIIVHKSTSFVYWNCTDHYDVAEIKGKSVTNHQGPVVQSLDNSIQWINRYPVEKMTPFVVLIG